MPTFEIDPLIAAAVVVATACTDAVYVLFTNAVVRRRRLPAATWSSIWYLLSSFAVINYTHHWSYVIFARSACSSAPISPSPSSILVPPIRRSRQALRRRNSSLLVIARLDRAIQ